MAWTAPITAVPNAALTAGQWNASVRDNLLETSPGKAGAGVPNGSYFVRTGTNAIGARTISQNTVNSSGTRDSDSYGAATNFGPAVSVTHGTMALVTVTARVSNSGSNASFMSVAISGAHTAAATDDRALRHVGTSFHQGSHSWLITGMTPGVSSFTAEYKAAAGTATFHHRQIIVQPF